MPAMIKEQLNQMPINSVIGKVQNHSGYEHVSMNQDHQLAGTSSGCKRAVTNISGNELFVDNIATVYMFAMLLMSNVSAYILRNFYR
jgi:hypothetical protein